MARDIGAGRRIQHDTDELERMYAVVGCTDCSALWVVEGRPETTKCPRCGKRRKFKKLRKFAETEDAAAAKEIRAAMLADRSGQREAFDELDSFAELEAQVDEAGINDEEYLEGAGIDTDAVADASQRAERGAGGSGQSRKETVLAALRNLDSPTEAEIIDYASERGLSEAYVETALDKLRRAGEISESGGEYRLL